MNLRNIMLFLLCVCVGIQTLSGYDAEIESLISECEAKGMERQQAQELIDAILTERQLPLTRAPTLSNNVERAKITYKAVKAIDILSSNKLARPIALALLNPNLNMRKIAIDRLFELKDPIVTPKIIQALEDNIAFRDRNTDHEMFVIDLVKLLNVLTDSNYQLDIYHDDELLRNSIVKSSIEKLGSQVLPARVTLKPEALNVSLGFLTAFVRLPEGYPATNITSATCDGAPCEKMMLSTAGGSASGGNKDGTEMIIKFRRQDIEKALAQIGQSIDTNFVVRGVWQDATRTLLFQGTASIKKIVGEKQKK